MECQEDTCGCCVPLGREISELKGELERARAAVDTQAAHAQRLAGLVEGAVMSLRALRTYGEDPKAVGDKLETQLFVELQRGGMTTWQLKPLLEHAIAVVAELERRGVKAFKMAVDADGNIIGPFDGGKNG